MRWMRHLVRRWLGHTAYHRQANEVQTRLLGAQLMAKRFEEARRRELAMRVQVRARR